MRVFRVETDDQSGPYHNRGVWERGYEHDLNIQHPAPSWDPGLKDRWNSLDSYSAQQSYSFGFASIQQFTDWFCYNKWLEALNANGYKLSVYDVDSRHVLLGDKQLVFKLNYATLVERRCLLDLAKEACVDIQPRKVASLLEAFQLTD